jgi:hypothetical protein
MVHNTKNYLVFGLRPSPGILKKKLDNTFRKLDLFPSSGEWGDPTLLSPLQTANLISTSIQ